MPEQHPQEAEPLARVVSALNSVAPELDGTALADLLWLASRLDGSAARGATASDAPPPEDAPTPQPSTGTPEPRSASATDRAGERSLHERLTGARGRVRGDAVAASGASGLPVPLSVSRALRPWKRSWPRGRRTAVDIDATVDAYARSGELVPQFRPAPERWFGLVLVVDCSPTMQVWQEVVDDFTAVLNRLGAFRTLQVCGLVFGERGPELRDTLGRLIGPGRLSSPDGRRLVITVSDCAHPGWRGPEVWRQLREWATTSPVALLNPLPVKLWRRTGLDLPGVRVLPGAPGADNSRLVFDPPPLLPAGDRAAWLPVPVLSLSPHSVGRWSRTVMRRSSVGCGAVLVPRTGRPPDVRPVPRAGSATADRFLRTASPAAARLAVLSSPFDEMSIRLLHLIRQELVPEAEVADVAELLTSGLFPVRTDQGGSVELRVPHPAQERLRKEITENEVWRINRALHRHMASLKGWSGHLPAVAQAPLGQAELPAALRPFAQASWRTLELLGLPAGGTSAAVTSESHTGTDPSWMPDSRPYFFLSYAHTPSWGEGRFDPDHWVRVFYQDLCDNIMAMTSLPAGAAVGYMDRGMSSGEDWSRELSESLASCRVLVPLISPRYFASDLCGREWYAFLERIIQAQADGALGRTSPIVPVLWTHVDFEQLPESVRGFQIHHPSYGDRYADDGIYGLIKLRRLRDEYEETVHRLARQIVSAAEEAPLPPGRPRPLTATPSAFKPRGDSPRRIHLTVAAPTRDSVPAFRDPRPYGESALDWNPYPSESTRPIAVLAEELTRALDYRVTVSTLDDEEGESDTDQGSPGILILDRWVLADEQRRDRLRLFDRQARPWQGAILPWSHADVQGHGEKGRRLSEQLEHTIPLTIERVLRTDTRIAVRGVPTLKTFTDVFPRVVAHVTGQYLQHATAHPPPGPATPRPRLMGPTHPPYPSPDVPSDRGDNA
ncbi:TIR-like protein FxsC [Streptomyces sp. NPDC058676]|uniref:TIR-like protein FxsC n=1 Tax=unclassified Streptomyces TaxID=2593676 RepID=UPI0036481000